MQRLAITGSRHGVYEDHRWLDPLREFIRLIHYEKLPLVGICFGHQIIAQALGGVVEKFQGGWSVGSTLYKYGNRDVNLNAWHQDQVIVPPSNAETVMTNDFCKFAGLAYDDNIITFQPHPEFNSDYIQGLIENRGKGIVPDNLLFTAKSKLDSLNDNDFLRLKLSHFLQSEFHYENILKYSEQSSRCSKSLCRREKGGRSRVHCF